MWKLMIADDQDQKTVVNLVRDEYTIGRAEGQSVRLTERNISRAHATITRSPTGFRLVDLRSYNGIYVNGVRLARQQELAHGDMIQLGDYRIQVIDEAIDTQEQGYRLMAGDSITSKSGRLPHRLVELIGPSQGKEYSLEGERFLIGRGTECEFSIDHGSVSRIHAEVRIIGEEKYEILDKGSANGLRINGHPLSRAILDSRDVIELGDVVLKYIPRGQDFRASASEGTRIAALAGSALPPTETTKPRTGLFPSLLAALVGAILALGLAYSFLSDSSSDQQQPLPTELSQIIEMIERDELSLAAERLETSDPALRSRPAFIKLEAAWARAVLKAKDHEENERRILLDLVAKNETLSETTRDAALKELATLSEGALSLGALDDESK